MRQNPDIKHSEDAWESRELGADSRYVRVSDRKSEAAIDDAVGLVAVSIRLQKSLVSDFKELAKAEGIGYQPLMRQALNQYMSAKKDKALKQPEIRLAAENGAIYEYEVEIREG